MSQNVIPIGHKIFVFCLESLHLSENSSFVLILAFEIPLPLVISNNQPPMGWVMIFFGIT